MPPAVAAAIITGTAALGSTAIAAKTGSNSAKRARELESLYSDKSLDAAREERDYQRRQEEAAIARAEEAKTYSRGERASYLDRLSPYRTVGTNAINRLDRSLAGNMAATVPTNASSAGGMVTMRAPNGQVKAIPAHLVSMAEQKGAVRI